MPKNTMICCDGTSHQPVNDMTNVAKLYFTLINDPIRQITFYHPGIGTVEPSGALTWLINSMNHRMSAYKSTVGSMTAS